MTLGGHSSHLGGLVVKKESTRPRVAVSSLFHPWQLIEVPFLVKYYECCGDT